MTTELPLIRQNHSLLRLAKSTTIDSGYLEPALREITETAAETLELERASVWIYAPDRVSILCLDLYENSTQRHLGGFEIFAEEAPHYFEVMAQDRFCAADDVFVHPAMVELRDSYFRKNGIVSCIDAPYRLAGQVMGMICLEHTGDQRYWSLEEKNFAGSLADLISRAYESAERRRAQDELERTLADLENRVHERTKELEEKNREIEEKMAEIVRLKYLQDADYYLTTQIVEPLLGNRNTSKKVITEFLIDQKKKLRFRQYDTQLGGDLCLTSTLDVGGSRCIFFINGDAMGKSMQGVIGAIVLATVGNYLLERAAREEFTKHTSPEMWLSLAFAEMQNIFSAFHGSMYASAIMGLVEESSGKVLYWIAGHPCPILFKDGRAAYIPNVKRMSKLGFIQKGVPDINTFMLSDGDALILGSDGKDEVLLREEDTLPLMNEDDSFILKIIEQANGNLHRVFDLIGEKADITDDLSLLKLTLRVSDNNEDIDG